MTTLTARECARRICMIEVALADARFPIELDVDLPVPDLSGVRLGVGSSPLDRLPQGKRAEVRDVLSLWIEEAFAALAGLLDTPASTYVEDSLVTARNPPGLLDVSRLVLPPTPKEHLEIRGPALFAKRVIQVARGELPGTTEAARLFALEYLLAERAGFRTDLWDCFRATWLPDEQANPPRLGEHDPSYDVIALPLARQAASAFKPYNWAIGLVGAGLDAPRPAMRTVTRTTSDSPTIVVGVDDHGYLTLNGARVLYREHGAKRTPWRAHVRREAKALLALAEGKHESLGKNGPKKLDAFLARQDPPMRAEVEQGMLVGLRRASDNAVVRVTRNP